MINETTLVATLNRLKEDGYTEDFNLFQDVLECKRLNQCWTPEDFKIDKVYRFEGMTDPDDQSILYAISDNTGTVKGTLVDGYGISSNAITQKMIKKFNIDHSNIKQ